MDYIGGLETFNYCTCTRRPVDHPRYGGSDVTVAHAQCASSHGMREMRAVLYKLYLCATEEMATGGYSSTSTISGDISDGRLVVQRVVCTLAILLF